MTVEVRFWGVRGSIPSPGRDTATYGGNTSCLEIRNSAGRVIVDAGSGIRLLGQQMVRQGEAESKTITILLSHTHWDHIQGLPFFAPAFMPGYELTLAGPETFNPTLERVILDQTRHSYFPLRMSSLGASFRYRELASGTYDDLIAGAIVRTCATNHPVVDLAYRIETEGVAIVYLMDHECWTDEYAEFVRRSPDSRLRRIERMVFDDLDAELKNFIAGADLMIADSAYTESEYAGRRGWGHSTHRQMWDLAVSCGVRRLAFSHHEPSRLDAELAEIEKSFQKENARQRRFLEVFAAREGTTVTIPAAG